MNFSIMNHAKERLENKKPPMARPNEASPEKTDFSGLARII
ncbi:hypothetical protein [Geoalkalibacter sp.]|nr:hypothetical protein [Geoalkalibacter sp.]